MTARRDAEYARATVAWYRANCPAVGRGISDEALARRVVTALAGARGLGLGRPEDATAYVALALAAGPAFVGDPAVRRCLSYPGCDPAQQLRRLARRVVDRIAQARRRLGQLPG